MRASSGHVPTPVYLIERLDREHLEARCAAVTSAASLDRQAIRRRTVTRFGIDLTDGYFGASANRATPHDATVWTGLMTSCRRPSWARPLG